MGTRNKQLAAYQDLQRARERLLAAAGVMQEEGTGRRALNPFTGVVIALLVGMLLGNSGALRRGLLHSLTITFGGLKSSSALLLSRLVRPTRSYHD